ncbi:LacI family DNA-binding transcriptional regulator [Paenibacillus rhizolycopersici]|uniref:LacI family DNA-binding transcriptional regulator n=1 Tax=Paenibacillus rhizolycopersici TaxID=2780073 RepID=UPI003D27C4C5
MATIYDIAEKLGISPSTVSRALSGRGYCKEETRKRVMQAAEEMDYAPDQSAKMLKTRVSNKVLFTVPDMCNPFYFDMIQGINDVLDPYGYLLILMDTKNRLDEEKRAIQLLREKYADGMIMVSFHFCEENIDLLNRLQAPVVLTNKYISPVGKDHFHYVWVDTQEGIKEVVRHFASQGISRIGYVGGRLQEQTGRERYEGYRDGLQEAKLSLRAEWIRESDYTEQGGYLAGLSLFDGSHLLPEAIICANDLMAYGFLRACEEKQIRVPEDLLLAGMDNLSLSSRTYPKLTSVSLQAEEIGRTAAEMLVRRMNGYNQPIENVKLLPELVVRDSSVSHRLTP